MKVPVIVAAIEARRAGELPGGEEPTPRERDLIEAAITRSDNDAALMLWDELDDGAARVEAVLRRAGDPATTVQREPDPRGYSSFGRTVWSLPAAATFYRALALGELLPPADTELVLDAMERIVPDQRWGIGTVAWDRPLRFKGGWGPSESAEGTYEVMQVGLVGSARDGIVVAIAAAAADFESAKRLASKHVPQHPNALQLRAPGDR